jgi:hypothetical protein
MIFLLAKFASFLKANFAIDLIICSFGQKENIITRILRTVNQIWISDDLLFELKCFVLLKDLFWDYLLELFLRGSSFTSILWAFDFGEGILILDQRSVSFLEAF